MLALGKLLPESSRSAGDTLWVDQTRTVHTRTAAAYGVIVGADPYDRAVQLEAGRLLQRVHLTATSQGVALQPMNELAVARRAGPVVTLAVGTVGGLILIVIPWPTARLSTATVVSLLLAATVPFAALTWWTIVMPLVAVLAPAVGLPLVVGRSRAGRMSTVT